jgi:hypothetical protein
MSPPEFPNHVYRAPSRKVLRQGDVAICEHTQLRARSGDRAAPGGEQAASSQVPFFGSPTDYEIELPGDPPATRVLRVWRGPVMVIDQNCEIEHAADQDSRLLVAPLASKAIWPEGPWDWLRRNQLPGYLYLPELAADRANFELDTDLAESVVVLGSTSLVSRALVQKRRFISLAQPMLPFLQEKVSRFFTTRGYASTRELEAMAGKRVVEVKRTDETVSGPSRLYKIVLGESDDDDGDDEITVSLGCRPTS